MIVSAALVVTAAMAGCCGPLLLRWALRARMPAPVRLAAWILLLGSMIAAGTGAVAAAFGAGHEVARRLVARPRLDVLPHREVLHLDEVVGGSGALLVAGAAGAFAAVVDHERSHLRGRHHWLVGFAHAVAAALPFVPLSADAAAGRRRGPATVRAALTRMHPARSTVTALRLEHLARSHDTATADGLLVLAAAALLPVSTAATLIVAGAWTAAPALLHF